MVLEKPSLMSQPVNGMCYLDFNGLNSTVFNLLLKKCYIKPPGGTLFTVRCCYLVAVNDTSTSVDKEDTTTVHEFFWFFHSFSFGMKSRITTPIIMMFVIILTVSDLLVHSYDSPVYDNIKTL